MLTPALRFDERQPPSKLRELMDYDFIDYDSYASAVRGLAAVNAQSLGYRATRGFLARAVERNEGPLTIVDMGSGYGDQLRAAGRFLASRNIRATLIGVDKSPHAARSATAVPFEEPGITLRFETDDVMNFVARESRPDIILSSLFMHHLERQDIITFLKFMDRNTARGWFINDIYRSRLAAQGFEVITRLSGRHPYISFDGPVSFSRGFRAADWHSLLAEAEIEGATIRLVHPFRLCVEKLHD